MEILISITAKIAEYTVAPIRRQANYLLSYKGNFKELADRVKELEATRVRTNHSIEQERRNKREIESDVIIWLEEVNEIIEKAKQLQRDPRCAKVGCSVKTFPNLILRHQLSRKAKKIAKEVVQVRDKGKFDRVGYLPALDIMPFSETFPTRGGVTLETRELFKEKIVKALEDSNASNIGIYGLGGVGKTTLVKEVAQIANQNKLFDAVVMTNISKTPDIKKIQKEIADRLDLQFGEETIDGRAYRLKRRIKAEKSILVILDGIWPSFELEKVGIPLVDKHPAHILDKQNTKQNVEQNVKQNVCKLLMTSRNKDVLLEKDTQEEFTFRLDLLSEAEAWGLFQYMAGDKVNDTRLQNVATQVAQKCAGLPLIIAIVAKGLKNKDIYTWKDALRHLESVGHAEMEAITYSALELSYSWLVSDEMKELLLLFALLPDALQGNDTEYLLNIGMGLDMFKDINTVDDARNKLHNIIESLKASCLLNEGNSSRSVQMNNFVRDVAISIARRDQHVFQREGPHELKEWPTKDFLKRCPYIILDGCEIYKLPERLDCPIIKFFFLGSENLSLEIPDYFFEGMETLRVLDLTHLSLSSLPTSFRSLTSLQTLSLDQCALENMDAIGSLKKLEILSLWGSSMIILPREIGTLTNLRLLNLSHSGIEVIPPNIISSLSKLEELYMGNTSIRWEDENSAKQNVNASLAELGQLFNLTALELQIREAWILPRDLKLMFGKLQRYKILIGDVWEWPDSEDGTLKTLMLKLGTNIHLEHGIKALIKGVESLYLDELDGIQNVLFQLNWEGFPLLKHLHIQNNANIKHIVDSMERKQVQVSFINLETIELKNLKNLEQICYGRHAINSLGKLSVIKVNNCAQLKYLLSYSAVKGLSQLSEIEVCQCNSMKEIVIEDPDSSVDNSTNKKIEFLSLHSLTLKDLQKVDNFFSYALTSIRTGQKYQGLESCVSTSFFDAQVSFPNLDTLKLSSLNLKNIWGDSQHFYKLTNLVVENCGGLKYLFLPSVVGNFINLKRLEISNCSSMEEIIATEEKNNGTDALKEIRFSKLDEIMLKNMENLKTIWHHQFYSLKTLEVNKCEKITVVFPSSLQKTYNNLEKLDIRECVLVEEIFELSSYEGGSKEDATHLKEITLSEMPKLKSIWSIDPQEILSFHNLKNVSLTNCESMEYLFPVSVATCCSHLETLHLTFCGNMKEIVAEKNGSMGATPIFEFNKLIHLDLWNLPKLQGFCAGNHTLTCPSLKTIFVSGCSKLNLFKSSFTSSHKMLQNGKLPIVEDVPLLIAEKVIPELDELFIDYRDAKMILQDKNLNDVFTKVTHLGLFNGVIQEAIFPYWFLQNVPTLEWLLVHSSSFKKIFQDEGLVKEESHTRLKGLLLYQLPELQHICEEGFQIDPVLKHLEYMEIDACPSLMMLSPSSVTFSHMTYLKITNCEGMIKLITSHTARSLVKLTTMIVNNCNSLEEIVTGSEDVEIALTSLVILTLECLPRFKKFCSSKCLLKLPLLEEVVVKECPRMKIFSEGNVSSPILQKVKTAQDVGKWHLKGNLNDKIKNMYDDKVAFCEFEHLTLSEYPEMKDLQYGQLQPNVFRNLKSLVVKQCDFLSNVLFPSNILQVVIGLEELEVRDCNSLEAVFDLKVIQSKEKLVKKTAELKKLTLSSLPKLKHIWNDDPHEIISFGKLEIVDVSDCQSLLNIFSPSLCQDLGHLEKLRIESCGVEEIVAMKEGSTKICFSFPQMNELALFRLTSLNSFYPGKHTLGCPLLKILKVIQCGALRVFSFNHSGFPQPDQMDEIHDIPFQQTLFSIEKVCPNLEDLALYAKDAVEILNGCYHENLFQKVEILRLQCFEETPITFLNGLHAICPNLATLEVRSSSFETLFLTGGIGHHSSQSPKKIRNLWLLELEQLRYIWHENFPVDLVVHHLEGLSLRNCPNLQSLVPSSSTLQNLTYLEVDNCRGLTYLITTETAKSLVQLKRLAINDCEMMLEVVMIDEEKTQEDIIFENLEILEFTSLLSLGSFCNGKQTLIFPSLLHLVVQGCPRMKIFSSGVTIVPFLTAVEVEKEKKRWKDDLNTTIEQLFVEKVAFCEFKHLTLSEYPDLKDLWSGQLQPNVFCNLKSLVVQRCDFLSDVLFPSNILQALLGLEELVVRDCDSLETVFDVKGIKSKEISVKWTTELKTLSLSSLPKLKHIWNEDPHGIISFGKLKIVDVSECQSLLTIFSLSLCQDLGYLEILRIWFCEHIKEIVAMEEGSMKNSINFHHMTELSLIGLTCLKSFYPGKHTLECPSLNILDVYQCEALKMFSFNHIGIQQPAQEDEIHDMPFQIALFSIEKLSPNLKILALCSKDALKILNGCCPENLFQKVEVLRLHRFEETPITFLNGFHAMFPKVVTLQVRASSFETLFLTGGIDHLNSRSPKRIKKLWLFELEQLRYIWQEDFAGDHFVVQDLEGLSVLNCPNLITLVPSSLSLKNLTDLEVGNCKGLIYLITTKTAKSLVQLKRLVIANCEMMSEIVKIDEKKAEEDVIFENLEHMEFFSLSSLESFCNEKQTFIFPSLLRFYVRGCPRLKIFSSGVTVTPFLTGIGVENQEVRWRDDLNTTIQQLFTEQEISHSMEK